MKCHRILYLVLVLLLAACVSSSPQNPIISESPLPALTVTATQLPVASPTTPNTATATFTLTPLPSSSATLSPIPSLTPTITKTPYGGSSGEIACVVPAGILIHNINTGKQEHISDKAASQIRWSIDGTKLILQSYPSLLCVIDVASQDEKCTQINTDLMVGRYGWSPDGERVIYARSDSDSKQGSLNIVNIFSGIKSTIDIDHRCAGDVRGISWTPDGDRIVFDCLGKIYALGEDGSDEVMLATDGLSQSSVLSPDGRAIAYLRDYLNKAEVYIMPIEGVGKSRKTTNSFVERELQWSLDSKKVAFISFYIYSHSQAKGDIYIFDTKENKLSQLTKNFGGWPEFTWSPDGNLIALTNGDDVLITNASNGETVETLHNLSCQTIAWRP